MHAGVDFAEWIGWDGDRKRARYFLLQGSCRSWKTWKVLEFYYGIFQDWKVLEEGHWSWKVVEICFPQLKDTKCLDGSKEN